MAGRQPHRLSTIAELHQFRDLPKPQHPLISVIDLQIVQHLRPDEPDSLLFDFYTVSLKRLLNAKVKYGQQPFDFDEGIMSFTAPGQIIGVKKMHGSGKLEQSGWMLLVHPDFLWNTSLAKTIKNYDFFDYRINEALFLSEKEELIIIEIMRNIEREYRSNIDNFSRDVMVSQIELLLNYSNRFYNRQFITRQKASGDLLIKLEDLLTAYFDRQNEAQTGLPTVKYLADNLNVSPNYLSDLLRTLTGQNTQQHIHNKLIEKAKEALSTTSFSVSEIAYRLGFEHPQSFSKLFKTKTNVSPLKFRDSFR